MEYLIAPTNADVFLQIYRDSTTDQDIEEALNFYNPVKYVIINNSQAVVEKSASTSLNKNRRPESDPNKILSCFHGMNIVKNLKRDHELSKQFNYDIVFRCRFDLLIILKDNIHSIIDKYLNQEFTNNIIIPDQHHWGGYNDKFAFGLTDTMNRYMSLINNVSLYFYQGIIFHPETYVKKHIEENELNPILTKDIRVETIREYKDDLFYTSPDNEWVDKNGNPKNNLLDKKSI